MSYLYIEHPDDYIQHHGIKGQQWGKRNGPPYPLSAHKHNKVVTRGAGKVHGAPSNADGTREMKKGGHQVFTKRVAEGALRGFEAGMRTGSLPAALTNAAISAAGAATIGTVKAIHANIKEKKSDKRKAAAEKDPKTGFALKDREWTPEEDMKAVNPGYQNFSDDTKNNCYMCSMAYDLRRRGYDVTANKVSNGMTLNSVERYYKNPKIERVTSAAPNPNAERKEARNGLTKETINKAKEQLIAQGDGARGSVLVTWKRGAGGHAMAYEVKDGKVSIYDAQVSTKYKRPEKVLKQAGSLSYVRLDNLEVNPKYIKEVAV